MQVFVIMATSGEYSDRREWTVCAYTDREAAKAHVEAAERRDREIRALEDERYDYPLFGGKRNEWDVRDPELDETRYWVEDVDVSDGPAAPLVQEAK